MPTRGVVGPLRVPAARPFYPRRLRSGTRYRADNGAPIAEYEAAVAVLAFRGKELGREGIVHLVPGPRSDRT